MTITLDLSDNASRVIKRKAANLGVSVDFLASEIVERGVKLVDIETLDKRPAARNGNVARPERLKLTVEESLQRMNDFDKRKDQFIASIRKSKG